MLENEFVINSPKWLTPNYSISPFSSFDISSNKDMPYSDLSDYYFMNRFKGRSFCYTQSGRDALAKALSKLNLVVTDCITIYTTSENLYISSCVTNEISKVCQWSREIQKNTKAILVNHEFGFAYENLNELKKHNLPIIEDCAFAFNSNNLESSVGLTGDFLIFSFPKFFPIQIGGLLVYNNKYEISSTLLSDESRYIKKVISHYIKNIDEFSEARTINYKYLSEIFSRIGFKERFQLNGRSIPGVFMFKCSENNDLNLLKTFLWNNGIESSKFYGENSFFIPVHHRLSKNDLEYLFIIIKSFLFNNQTI